MTDLSKKELRALGTSIGLENIKKVKRHNPQQQKGTYSLIAERDDTIVIICGEHFTAFVNHTRNLKNRDISQALRSYGFVNPYSMTHEF